MQSVSYQDLINREELQLLQNEFCRVAGVYACCLNDRRESVTELSSTGSGVFEGLSRDEVVSLKGSPYTQRALERVEPDSLEDTAIERFPGGRVAVMAIRMDGRTLLYWLLFDCSNREEGKFAQVLDLLRDASGAFYRYKLSSFSAEMESMRSLSARQEMGRDLQRVEATTGMVQLLDSDERIELVTEQWLGILGQYLQAESAGLYRLSADERTMDLLGQWCNRGIRPPFDKTGGLDACTLFRTDRPLVFSTGAIPGEHRWEAEHYGWSAIMVFPVIEGNDGTATVLAVDYRESGHNWESAEVKFAADAVRLLRSILTRRMQRDSLTGSHAALETVLDNVGCAVCVTDRRDGSLLFANRRLRSVFAAELRNRTFHGLLEQGRQRVAEGGMSEIFHEDTARWYEMNNKDMVWVDGRSVTLYSFYDITDRKKQTM